MNLKTNLFNSEVQVKKNHKISHTIITLIYFAIVFIAVAVINNDAFSQDLKLNNYVNEEDVLTESRDGELIYPSELDDQLKSALENGNNAESVRLQSEIEKQTPKENFYISKQSNDVRFEAGAESGNQTDWLSTDPVVFEGDIKSLPSYGRQIDMKCGDDNILYAAVNAKESPGIYGGKVAFYSSENNGSSWQYAGSIYTAVNIYITNISLLVESRNNSIADSTRLILFYTKSGSNNNDLSVLSYASFRRNGTAFQSGDIASSGAGKEISHICAVSDGAYFQSATYIGVVCSESDLSYTNNSGIKVFRSVNWGVSFIGATITTGYNDFYPSADFYKGSISELYIAVERRTSAGLKNLWLIKTGWSPSSSFTSYQISNISPIEKPCIAIQKKTSPDSMMITVTNAGTGVYFSSGNSGTNWSAFNLSQGNANNFKYTHCYASSSGSPTFTALYSTADGDTINVRRGELGYMGEVFFKMNGNNFDPDIMPVCLLSPGNNARLASILYAGNSSDNLYFDQEGFKSVYVQFLIQGFYNPEENKLSRRDTVTMFLRKGTSPYEIVDSARSVLDSVDYFPLFDFARVNLSESYYLVIKHRNSIETWSKLPINLNSGYNYWYDFSINPNAAFGNNTIQVNNSPVRYALYSGDVNQEGTIDLADVLLVYNDASEFAAGYRNTDVTGNDITDLSDLVLTYNNANSFVSVKKP